MTENCAYMSLCLCVYIIHNIMYIYGVCHIRYPLEQLPQQSNTFYFHYYIISRVLHY